MGEAMRRAGPNRSGLLPELRRTLEALDAEGPAVRMDEVEPAVERVASEERIKLLWGELDPVDRVENLSFKSAGHAIEARLYRPKRAEGTVLFIHGGGWVVGSLDTHDGSVRVLANAIPANVLSIGYRKAPEHPFPAAVHDVDAGLDWLLRDGAGLGLDTERIIVCGDSAGGNLAAVLVRHARDRSIALAGQVLIYPVTDCSMASASYRDFAAGFYLSAEAMAWFIRHYLGNANRAHPDAAPLQAVNLGGLAPAFVATAAFDPLRDEGRAYAARLVQAGNDVTYREIAGAVHGLWVMNTQTPAAKKLIGAAADWIRARWGAKSQFGSPDGQPQGRERTTAGVANAPTI